ncbi:hypothetical protein F5Y04DRAFT_112926 [Hypomontagnella monticulosa]|nr:hypothetical protein F5Y04DRAFT_112926 [Hypomontagnella monticulosa]
MDPDKEPDSLVKASSNLQTEAYNHGPTPLITEDDEIPLDSSSEESQSSSAAMSDSSSEDEEGPLISTGNERIPSQPSRQNAIVSHAPSAQQSQDKSRKRKSLEGADTVPHAAIPNKKVKLDEEDVNKPSSPSARLSGKSLLPAEIWHRIFTFTPPRTLGNLLCINKLFNVYLDPSSRYQCNPPPSLSESSVLPLKPDVIWQLSRRRFWPRMPAPLQQKTELDMWRLACAKSCQFCGKIDSSPPGSPGERCRHKIQPVWPFALRSCNVCLMEKTVKEIDLLLSSSMPSLLISALPFVLVTSETVIISPDALQKGAVRPDLQVTKIYLSDHIEALKQEFLAVKSMGGATAEEWLKGLEARGKDLLSDSMRWEKWASTGGVAQIQTLLTPDSLTASSSKGSLPTDVSLLAPRSNSNTSSVTGQDTPNSYHTAPIVGATLQPTHPAAPLEYDSVTRIPSSIQHSLQPNAPRARTREEALELKAARRAEIERRAMELDPPLPAYILARIPSFQAAIQIISPLDDSAWDLLKPRLLAQRADAEQRELHEQAATQSLITPECAEEHNTDENSMVTKQLVDKAWDDVQAPLRARISAYADEIIRDMWDDGRKVDIENSPQFAAEVLLHVRSKFYAEVAKDSAAKRRAGQELDEDPPEGPFTKKLTLENMKWLFDVKIKPHTESYRKDLFFCNGCEVNIKAFGFEGVIQHYAAKHTSTLSLGSIVVHWRAGWPETPPFKADPRAVKTISQSAGSSSYGALQSQSNVPHNQHNANVYSSASIPTPLHPPTYFNVLPPSYGHLAYGLAANPAAPYGQGSSYTPEQHDYGSHYPPHHSPYTPQGATYPNSQLPFSPGVYAVPPPLPPTADVYHGHNFDVRQSNSLPNFTNTHGNSLAGKYNAQLEYLARSSRELWNLTAGLKELRGDIRVHVVIHHIACRFRAKFSENPPLSMFIDGLSNNKEMRPVRNVNGLVCKACYDRPESGMLADQDRKTFSLPQLVNHFQQRHIYQPHTTVPLLDWTVSMVHTPDPSVLSNLLRSTNIDSHKLSLIFDAFPMTEYLGSYPKSQPSASPQNYGPRAAITSYSGQQSNYDTPALHYASHHNPSNLHSSTIHDVTTPSGHQDATFAFTSSQEVDLGPSTIGHTPPLMGYRKPHHDNSGRVSPETWRGYNGSKLKRRQGTSTQDRRTTPSQSFKNRKGNSRSTPTRIKSQEPGEEDLVAEDERRQGEEIKAMWAADRMEAARLASIDQRPVQLGESEALAALPETERPKVPLSPMAQAARSPIHTARIRGHQQAPAAHEYEEDDLMAGLESQLDQQRVRPERFEYGLRHPNNVITEKRPLYEQDVHCNENIRSNQRNSYDRVYSGHHTYARQEPEPSISQPRESRSGSGTVDLYHAPTRTAATQDDTPYDRHSHHDYHRAYVNQSRQPAEAYELIPALDSHGPYFIKRPVRLERERTYMTLHDRHPLNEEAPYKTYENDRPPGSHRGYKSTSRTSTPLRQPAYDGDPNLDTTSRDNHIVYGEYDSRFPTEPPGPIITQQTRYR